MSHAREKVREELLTDGLVDLVDLSLINWRVLQQNRSASVSEVQHETLEVIRSMVSDGLFQLGYRGEGGRFVAWDEALDQSMNAIYDAYVTHHDDRPGWVWFAWLNLTDKGKEVALSTEYGRQVAEDVEQRLRETGDVHD